MNKREHLTGQAGALEEVEITPEMIEAGVAELCGFNPDDDSKALAATRIFLAMEEARLKCTV